MNKHLNAFLERSFEYQITKSTYVLLCLNLPNNEINTNLIKAILIIFNVPKKDLGSW